jgi:uncharacterized delta-60 repeat protein
VKRSVIRKSLAACGLMVLLVPTGLIGPKTAAARQIEPQAAAGKLDPSFGTGGKVVTDFGVSFSDAFSVAVQPDGRIVVAGEASAPTDANSTIFGLARYNSDGSLDASFGSGGKVTTSFSQGASQGEALALQQDGKIVAAGLVQLSSDHTLFAIARYNSNGALDPGFGAGGQATVDFGVGLNFANAIAIQADGKIVLAGQALYITSNGQSQFGLARLSPEGTLDLSFGNGGMVTGPSISAINAAKGLAIQPDGKIVVSGYSRANTASGDWAVARYNADGSLDSTFGASGAVTTRFLGLGDVASSVLVLADGKLIVTGYAFVGQGEIDFALARYDASGTLDPSFGNGGKVTTAFPGGVAVGTRGALQPDGKTLLTGGFYSNPNDSKTADVAIARYNADGTLDAAFGTSGLVTTDFNGLFDFGYAVAVQQNGNIVVAGAAQKPASEGSMEEFAVLRYLGGTFSLGLSESSISAQRGTTAKVGILINRTGGVSGKVTVTPPVPPPGVKIRPAMPVSSAGQQVSFKLKITRSAPAGPQQLTFTGKSADGQLSTVTLTLKVQ